MELKQKLQKIIDSWFLSEPFLFEIYCTHTLKESSLEVPMRSGKGLIEYDKELCQDLSQNALEEFLKLEVFRIALNHPYQRQPINANRVALYLASTITITDNCKFYLNLPKPEHFKLEKNCAFEVYYRKLLENLSKEMQESFDEDTQEDLEDLQAQSIDFESTSLMDLNLSKIAKSCTQNWQDDETQAELINSIVENVLRNAKSFGTISGDFIGLLELSLKAKMDYRRYLRAFRHSILSSKRRLVRNKPSRRYGFAYFGSTYEFSTKLLIAVDVSASISNEALQKFFYIINRFFKYGIERLDVLQFDTEIQGEIITLKKAQKCVKVQGCGGTDFEPVIRYYEAHKEYDGLIIFSDGDAPPVNARNSRPKLFVLENSEQYSDFLEEPLPKGSKCTYLT
ncbi:VWA-like domain-containing protein [Helicobacter burdigaliensis]|uniref:VWA-like domain-containing protein n=1 Tax=Helicobacter burdigaliensis TaxID=2315334 RepID=UPI000EF670A1|nr:VWA-like domain-containing protein [Helicobacter burdigaliensis]